MSEHPVVTDGKRELQVWQKFLSDLNTRRFKASDDGQSWEEFRAKYIPFAEEKIAELTQLIEKG
jgi:hypothetical protein